MPSKRKEHPLTEASPAKRKANRDQGDVPEEAEDSWERRAGMILEVSMRNFMCHQVTYCLVSDRIIPNITMYLDLHLQT